MKLKEAFESYSFNNVGQFRALADTLGYQTEYHDGRFLFRKGSDSLSLSMEEIRSKSQENRNDNRIETSKEKVVSFLTRERPMIPHIWRSCKRKAST